MSRPGSGGSVETVATTIVAWVVSVARSSKPGFGGATVSRTMLAGRAGPTFPASSRSATQSRFALSPPEKTKVVAGESGSQEGAPGSVQSSLSNTAISLTVTSPVGHCTLATTIGVDA